MACSWLTRELGNYSREFYEYITPAIDIFEDDNELVVKIDLPGYAKKDINLSIEEDILRIRAKKELDKETRIGSIYYKQRPRQIDKSIVLPISTQDGTKVVKAEAYVDGVVTVRIPIAEPHNIQIL